MVVGIALCVVNLVVVLFAKKHEEKFMSPIPTLSSAQLFRSHIASCSICRAFKSVKITQMGEGQYNVETQRNTHPRLCPVGATLLAKAQKEGKIDSSPRKKSFPFVAKLHEKIKARIHGKWVECVVKDRSIAASYMYEKYDDETKKKHWRTAAPTIVGYEVEVNEERFYVRPTEVRPLEKYVPKQRPNSIMEIKIKK